MSVWSETTTTTTKSMAKVEMEKFSSQMQSTGKFVFDEAEGNKRQTVRQTDRQSVRQADGMKKIAFFSRMIYLI